ncbi:MAG: hypothetical protein PQJ46_13810 [Spirochaetales bacterium]|nr:hypothetical protein [Spirochaetales bacterium]
MIKIQKNKIIFLILILTILCFAEYSCTRSDEKKVDAKPALQSEKQEKNKDNINNNEESTKDEETISVNQIADTSAPENIDFLLYPKDYRDTIIFNDFKIGELQKKDELFSGAEEDVYNLAVKFLQSLKFKKLDETIIYSEKYDFLKRNMDLWLEEKKIDNYRIAVINTEGETYYTEVRLLSGDKFYNGTIYFINKNGWKIFDFQLDFDENNKKDNEQNIFELSHD